MNNSSVYGNQWSSWVPAVYGRMPHNIECPVEECLRRISVRNRHGDENITGEYLRRIHGLYETLAEKSGGQSLKNYGLRNSLLESVRTVTECCPR
jgi:thymidylate kinase